MIQGELPLNDNVGDPKFPTFLYDEDVMDGSFMTGLLRGRLLLKVCPTVFMRRMSPIDGLFCRHTLPSLSRLLPLLVQRCR